MSIRLRAPDGYQREFQVLCPRYFVKWNQMLDRWEVQAWEIKPMFTPKPSKIEDWIRRGIHSYLIRRCFKEDDEGRDIGFKPLDHRFVLDNMIGMYNLQQVKRLLAAIDRHNAKKEEQADAQETYEHRAAAKAIYKHLREPSVYLGGN